MSPALFAVALVVIAVGLVVLLGRGRRARANLLARERQLAQLQKMEMVGRLAGGIAHDVNNYLATIRAHSEIVARRELPREQVVAKMKLIEANVLKASGLIERLLTFARRQPLSPELVDLNEVAESVSAMGLGAVREGVEVTLDVEDGLPLVEVDLAAIEGVLANLIVNARDAIEGTGTITIRTRSAAGPGGEQLVELAVADTGRGIAPEHLPQIFEPFFSTKAGQGATGLGLATVQSVVQEAGGRVLVESTPGHGATFRVRLPARGPRRERGAAPARVAPNLAAKGERILLVDDNRDLALGVAAQLESLGYAVTSVASAEEALAAVAASARPFDLVVTDVMLEGMPGTVMVDRLRKCGPLPALYMSGFTDRIALRRGPGAAEAYFLKKPFSAEGLARMVRELLDATQAAGG